MAPLHKSTSSEWFHVVQDFLASGPLGYALTQPTQILEKFVQQIWNNSTVAEHGDIVFTCAENTFFIMRDVIVKALKLSEGLSANILYTENEMKGFLVEIGYNWGHATNGSLSEDKIKERMEFLL